MIDRWPAAGQGTRQAGTRPRPHSRRFRVLRSNYCAAMRVMMAAASRRTMAEDKNPKPDSLRELNHMIRGLRDVGAEERRAKHDARAPLLSTWDRIAPLLAEAVERVNAALQMHSYAGIEMAAPQFNRSDGPSYGAEGRIPGINHGDLVVALSSDMVLYVNANRCGHWSDGHSIPIHDASVVLIAHAIAKVAKQLIAEQPA
jgi:hypothetical protein